MQDSRTLTTPSKPFTSLGDGDYDYRVNKSITVMHDSKVFTIEEVDVIGEIREGVARSSSKKRVIN